MMGQPVDSGNVKPRLALLVESSLEVADGSMTVTAQQRCKNRCLFSFGEENQTRNLNSLAVFVAEEPFYGQICVAFIWAE